MRISDWSSDVCSSDLTSADGKWGTLDDTARFLSIMGTADGFSAAGAGSPCFPGKDNSKLDLDLKAAGFDTKAPTELAAALAQLSSPASECAKLRSEEHKSELQSLMRN